MDGSALTLLTLAAALQASLGWQAARRHGSRARPEGAGPPPWLIWTLAVASLALYLVGAARIPADALGLRVAALAAPLACGALGWAAGRTAGGAGRAR